MCSISVLVCSVQERDVISESHSFFLLLYDFVVGQIFGGIGFGVGRSTQYLIALDLGHLLKKRGRILWTVVVYYICWPVWLERKREFSKILKNQFMSVGTRSRLERLFGQGRA